MLDEVAAAPPTAELRPIERVSLSDRRSTLSSAVDFLYCPTIANSWDVDDHNQQKKRQRDGDGAEGGTEEEGAAEEHSQVDEEDMGMSYRELGIYGTLRKIERCVRACLKITG